ncbi:MAG: hypothetical protein J5U17_05880 [Candidatus Methanoperedens sp.]|nr:hypothetical protein [Candidatus Methanoperedens sp.]MCE8425290.1 hypothetical protein [Candidatus Methanoperedens sp.]MCE8427811.1 hypothetical protein [Candidatus Methanoperedens sp.]
MSECFLCNSVLEPVNDAEIEDVELCVDCCENIDTVIRDYLASSPGGMELILDIITEDLSSPESRLKDKLKDIIREVMTEE